MRRSPTSPHGGIRAFDTPAFTLGRDRFSRIDAVAGITLTEEMRAAFGRFDRDGLSAEERRRAIIRRFSTAQ